MCPESTGHIMGSWTQYTLDAKLSGPQSKKRGDWHECSGCWHLQEARSRRLSPMRITRRFIVITDARGGTARYAIGDPVTKAYLEARGFDWR